MKRENGLPEVCAETRVRRRVLVVAPYLKWRILRLLSCETLGFGFLLWETQEKGWEIKTWAPKRLDGAWNNLL